MILGIKDWNSPVFPFILFIWTIFSILTLLIPPQHWLARRLNLSVRVFLPEWQLEPHTLKRLIASSSPPSLTCCHHFPNQPMKPHCVMLCFNQSLNLLLGFYRLSRLAFVFKPSVQNMGSNKTVNSNRKRFNLRDQKVNRHLFRNCCNLPTPNVARPTK